MNNIFILVLEVVSGDYGDITDFLCKAAADDKWRKGLPFSELVKYFLDIK